MSPDDVAVKVMLDVEQLGPYEHVPLKFHVPRLRLALDHVGVAHGEVFPVNEHHDAATFDVLWERVHSMPGFG